MEGSKGFAFLLLVGAALGIWYLVKSQTAPVDVNADTIKAGTDVVPTVPVSNDPAISGNDWSGTPYYLRANYPVNRYAGMIAPYIVSNGLPAVYGPQEQAPQLL